MLYYLESDAGETFERVVGAECVGGTAIGTNAMSKPIYAEEDGGIQ